MDTSVGAGERYVGRLGDSNAVVSRTEATD